MDKEYVVTLKSKDDLEDFYAEMSSNGFKIAKKRPISRNTHYYMTAEQAEENTDWLEDDCLVNTVSLSLYNVKGIQTKFTYSYSNSLYSQPYYSIVYPPPEFLISM